MSSEAYDLGFEHGQNVPANLANREQAWSDFKAVQDRGEITLADMDQYVEGHMAGQAAK